MPAFKQRVLPDGAALRDTGFRALLEANRLPQPIAEYCFARHLKRRWRFDYCWPVRHVALEVEGGAWVGGRHTRGAGFLADCEKYSEAAALGFRVIRVAPQDLCTSRTIDWLKRALEAA